MFGYGSDLVTLLGMVCKQLRRARRPVQLVLSVIHVVACFAFFAELRERHPAPANDCALACARQGASLCGPGGCDKQKDVSVPTTEREPTTEQ